MGFLKHTDETLRRDETTLDRARAIVRGSVVRIPGGGFAPVFVWRPVCIRGLGS